MMVTHETADSKFDFDNSRRRSIELAVAQHMRSRRGVDTARKALLELGVSEDEIVRRRRAESTDRDLARALRLAVTIVITRGRLTDAERRNISRWFSEDAWSEIVETTTDAYATVVRAETLPAPAPEPTVDLDIGDY